MFEVRRRMTNRYSATEWNSIVPFACSFSFALFSLLIFHCRPKPIDQLIWNELFCLSIICLIPTSMNWQQTSISKCLPISRRLNVYGGREPTECIEIYWKWIEWNWFWLAFYQSNQNGTGLNETPAALLISSYVQITHFIVLNFELQSVYLAHACIAFGIVQFRNYKWSMLISVDCGSARFQLRTFEPRADWPKFFK